MKENRRLSLLSRLAIGLAVVFLAACAVLVYFYVTPLAPAMAVDKSGGTEPLAAMAAKDQGSSAQKTGQKTDQVCGNTGSMLLLFTGEDFTEGVWPLGADTVRVAKIDFSNRRIVVVGFPRDLWVDTPGLASMNYPETRLGLAYHYKKEGTNGSDKHKLTVATEQIAQALFDNFGLEPEKYFTIQLQNTPEMIDAIGGIDINVPEGFTSEYGVTFEAGMQHMDGATAAEYVRAFAEDEEEGDLLRFPRQNVFIKALQDRVLSADVITKVPDLYKEFDKAIVTDLSPKQIADIACMAKEVPQADIEFHEITPPDLATEADDLVLTPNVEAIKQALIEWLDI